MLAADSNKHPTRDGHRPRRALIVQHSANAGGSSESCLLSIRALQSHDFEVDIAFAFAGDYLEKAQSLGCRTHVVPHDNWLRSNRVGSALRAWIKEVPPFVDFCSLLRANDYKIVYVNTIVSGAAALAAKRAGVPCVWHIRELFQDEGGEVFVPPIGGKAIVRYALKSCSSHIVVNSNAVARNFFGEAIPPNVSVIYNSVVDGLFKESSSLLSGSLRTRPGAFHIGVPGTLRPMKGHGCFFSAIAAYRGQLPKSFQLLIAGSGKPEYVASLERQVRELELDDVTTFLGTVESMADFYRSCDLICIPSLSEPFGRVAIEAAALGKAIVSTTAGGLSEIFRDGVDAVLVAPNAPKEMGAAIVRLSGGAEERARLGYNAKVMASSRFGSQRYISELGDLLLRTALR